MRFHAPAVRACEDQRAAQQKGNNGNLNWPPRENTISDPRVKGLPVQASTEALASWRVLPLDFRYRDS
jgi:hypothetical protein